MKEKNKTGAGLGDQFTAKQASVFAAGKETTLAGEREEKFTVEQLKRAKRYTGRRDLLGVLLQKDRDYTIAEADAALAQFAERMVK